MPARPLIATLALAVALAVAAGCGGGDEPARTPAPAPDPLVRALRAGGHTLVLRHALTGAEVATRERIGSCASQRNLTATGREQARAIGRALRALRIPVGAVRASPLCRTEQTARLAFGRATIDRDLVTPGVVGSEADDRRRGRRLRARAGRPPADGTNAVLVTHMGTMRAAFGTVTEASEEGETFVFGPGARLVARVPAERWAQLARAGRPPD